MSINYTDYNLQSIFQEELMPDESVLWAGQPDPSSIFRKEDAAVIPFSVIWLGFSVFWTASAYFGTRNIPNVPNDPTGKMFSIFFPLFGVPFVLIGIYMLFGRIFFRKMKQKYIFYAVTNKRIMIMNKSKGKDLTTLSFDSIVDFQKNVGRNGLGTISFNTSSANYNYRYNNAYGGGIAPYAFDMIRDVDNVYDIISRQKAAIEDKH